MATGRLPDPNTAPLTAKGDLYTYSTVPARLAVGSNGDTLVADSSTSTGLRWQEPKAGNPVINSAFQVWQRGTSHSLAAGSTKVFSADRWAATVGANQATTISRQTTGDTTNLPNIQYCARVQRNSGQTGTGGMNFFQSFETINSIPFVGKTVTLSFYARRGANYSATSNLLNFYLQTGTGTDESYGAYTGASNAINTTATLTTTWQRFSATATLSSSANELSIIFIYNPTGTAGASDFFEVTGVQLELGSVPTPFNTQGVTLAGELAACRRYLPAFIAGASDTLEYIGYAVSNSLTVFTIPFDVPARVKPTGATVNISGSINAFALNTPTAVTPAFNTAGVYSGTVTASISTTGGQGSRLQILNGSSILFTGCEL